MVIICVIKVICDIITGTGDCYRVLAASGLRSRDENIVTTITAVEHSTAKATICGGFRWTAKVGLKAI